MIFVSAPHSGVLGHPQPVVGHDKPMILVHDRAALLGLLTALFRMISKLLRLGHRGHCLSTIKLPMVNFDRGRSFQDRLRNLLPIACVLVNRALSGIPQRGGDRGMAQRSQGLPAEDGRASALWVCSKGG